MSAFYSKMTSFIIMSFAVILPNLSLAQSQTALTQNDQPSRVSIVYVPPQNSTFQQLYDLLRERRALEKIQGILSPLQVPEQLSIKTTECGAVNSYYQRENVKPTVTICYELLKHILDSVPNEITPAGVTPADATVGQFLFVTLHEVGHAAFDMFGVPIFGHEEDAADNFATYTMLQFGRGQARRLIAGAAWAWRAYLGALHEESRDADAASRLCKRSWSAAGTLLQPYMPGVRGQQTGLCRCGALFAADALAKMLL